MPVMAWLLDELELCTCRRALVCVPSHARTDLDCGPQSLPVGVSAILPAQFCTSHTLRREPTSPLCRSPLPLYRTRPDRLAVVRAGSWSCVQVRPGLNRWSRFQVRSKINLGTFSRG